MRKVMCKEFIMDFLSDYLDVTKGVSEGRIWSATTCS